LRSTHRENFIIHFTIHARTPAVAELGPFGITNKIENEIGL